MTTMFKVNGPQVGLEQPVGPGSDIEMYPEGLAEDNPIWAYVLWADSEIKY